MDYMTLKEAGEKWGVTPMDKLLLCRRPYSRCHENSDNLVDTQRGQKAG